MTKYVSSLCEFLPMKIKASHGYHYVKPSKKNNNSVDSGAESDEKKFNLSDKNRNWPLMARIEYLAMKASFHKLLTAPNGGYFTPVSQSRLQQVAEIVESDILSDTALRKNNYLYRAVKKGPVSINFIKGLRSKALPSSNNIALALALFGEHSDFEVSTCGKYVKRLKPFGQELLDLQEPKQKQFVVAINLQDTYVKNPEFLKKMVSFEGIPAIHVEIFSDNIPSNVKNFAKTIPDFGKTICAVLKYEDEHKAMKAAALIQKRKAVNGLTAAHLGKSVRKNLYGKKYDACSLSTSSESSGRSSIVKEYKKFNIGTKVQQRVLIKLGH